jgi:hypothetical protein
MAHHDRRSSRWRFALANVVVWVVMTIILVVVPDTLEQWMPLAIARVIGWAASCSIWVVAVESGWQRRLGVGARFLVQLGLWVTAALVAMWISDKFRVE